MADITARLLCVFFVGLLGAGGHVAWTFENCGVLRERHLAAVNAGSIPSALIEHICDGFVIDAVGAASIRNRESKIV